MPTPNRQPGTACQPAADRPRFSALLKWLPLGLGIASVLAAGGAPGGAQTIEVLDENCVVSAFNRTAPVQADGSWVLPDVPTTLGPVRVRATCVRDGQTTSGQSGLVSVPLDDVVFVPDVRFEQPIAIPQRLALSAPVAALDALGATAQVTVTGVFADGSQADLTAETSGTTYSVSNPAVLRLDGDGQVTAVGPGVALVSALHEGALGVLRLEVVTSGDSDADGMPDDFEIANGLDPGNPADAFDDPDRDNLTNLEEFQAGTDLRNPDTDGDGLEDGEETSTNPLLFDTDGDLVSDGLELLAGSDPLDPLSANLAPILESFTVEPPSFVLTFNTVIGEASRKLRVPVRLVDGTELDAAGARYGTTYTSSDLTVANFGSDPGRVFAGADGTAVVTATIGAFWATAEVTVRTFTPTALSFLHVPGFLNAVDLAGPYAWVAAGGRGVHAIDVSDPERPFLAGSIDTDGVAYDVHVDGTVAYVADGRNGVTVLDVSDAARPTRITSVRWTAEARGVAVRDGRLYVATGGLRVFDVTDPTAPALLGELEMPEVAFGVDVIGDRAVLAAWSAGFVVDVSDPAAPVLLGTIPLGANDVTLRGDRAYWPRGTGSLGGLAVIDLRAPDVPVVAGRTDDRFGLTAVALERDFAVASDYFFANAVPIFNVGFSETPVASGVLDFSGAPSFRDDNGTDVAVRHGLVYMTGNSSLATFGTLGDGGLHIGRYLVVEDGEAVPPSVVLTEPVEGTSVPERRFVTLAAEATDDVRVARVEFLVDGEVVHEDFGAPFEHTYRVPAGPPSLRLGARAFDLGGNSALAEEVVLEVVADSAPTVDLLSPRADTRAVEGTELVVAAEATDDFEVVSVELVVDGIAREVLTAPPYRIDVLLPLGVAAVTVSATATDEVGQTATAGPRVVPVEDDPPPEVAILQPVDGAEAVEATRLDVVVGASDAGGLARVRLLVDGAEAAVVVEAPYTFQVAVPPSGTELVLSAVAEDDLGQASSSVSRVVSVPDPGTTAFGDVESEEGAPVAGAEVTCGLVTGTSGGDGTFSLPGVSTFEDVVCTARFSDGSGNEASGTSEPTAANPGGITDVGGIVLETSGFVVDLGRRLHLFDVGAAELELPFSFPFFGASYSTIYVSYNGTITFRAPSFDAREDAQAFVTGFHDRGATDVGPAIAVFWDELQQDVVGELDVYRFEGFAGTSPVIEVTAARVGSSLDSVITLYDEDGRRLAINDDYGSLDSKIEFFPLPRTGTYFVSVQDFSYLGGPDYFYSLTARLGNPIPIQVPEVEPNDSLLAATPLANGDVANGVISAPGDENAADGYVNDGLGDRVMLTWNRMPERRDLGANTFQAVLYSDGRIEIAYRGVMSDDSIVGVSPANGTSVMVDWSVEAPFSTSGPVAVFEEFDGPNGPDSGGGDVGELPFDLDGRVLRFVPNASGGYDVGLE